jgi:hypothetical protein
MQVDLKLRWDYLLSRETSVILVCVRKTFLDCSVVFAYAQKTIVDCLIYKLGNV